MATYTKKLLRMIRYAHAAEHGAYWAYDGHAKAKLKPHQSSYLEMIKRDEKDHIEILEQLLKRFGSKPNKSLDLIFIGIGKVLGVLSGITGYYLPMRVAGFMEKLGTDGYVNMAKEAMKTRNVELFHVFMDMAEVESSHEDWFKEVLK